MKTVPQAYSIPRPPIDCLSLLLIKDSWLCFPMQVSSSVSLRCSIEIYFGAVWQGIAYPPCDLYTFFHASLPRNFPIPLVLVYASHRLFPCLSSPSCQWRIQQIWSLGACQIDKSYLQTRGITQLLFFPSLLSLHLTPTFPPFWSQLNHLCLS